MPIGDIEDQAKARCRMMFPDDEEKRKECVPAAITSLQPEGTISLEEKVIAQQKLYGLQESKIEKEEQQ